jgi:hypothetical protein
MISASPIFLKIGHCGKFYRFTMKEGALAHALNRFSPDLIWTQGFKELAHNGPGAAARIADTVLAAHRALCAFKKGTE